MPQNARKQLTVCRNCNTRYIGTYCPYCGVENGEKRARRSHGGFFSGLVQFIVSLLILTLILVVTFIVLDYVAAAEGDAHTAARAILDSVRNAIPPAALDAYASVKSQYLDRWVAAVVNFFAIAFR
jgi:hypothetical protein